MNSQSILKHAGDTAIYIYKCENASLPFFRTLSFTLAETKYAYDVESADIPYILITDKCHETTQHLLCMQNFTNSSITHNNFMSWQS